MGCFSWLDCKTKKQIKIGGTAIVLIPKEFGGKYYKDDCYDGYGRVNGYDVYDLVAIWNKGFISEKNLMPEPPLEKFGGLYGFEKQSLREQGYSEEEIEKRDRAERQKYYDQAMKRRKRDIKMLKDFNSGKSDEYLRDAYGDDYLRNIGINVACYDKQNAALKYPIKLSHRTTDVYEECGPSLSDPDQGF